MEQSSFQTSYQVLEMRSIYAAVTIPVSCLIGYLVLRRPKP